MNKLVYGVMTGLIVLIIALSGVCGYLWSFKAGEMQKSFEAGSIKTAEDLANSIVNEIKKNGTIVLGNASEQFPLMTKEACQSILGQQANAPVSE